MTNETTLSKMMRRYNTTAKPIIVGKQRKKKGLAVQKGYDCKD